MDQLEPIQMSLVCRLSEMICHNFPRFRFHLINMYCSHKHGILLWLCPLALKVAAQCFILYNNVLGY